MSKHRLATHLASAAVVGEWTLPGVLQRVSRVLGIEKSDLAALPQHMELRAGLRGVVTAFEFAPPLDVVTGVLAQILPSSGYRLVNVPLQPEAPRTQWDIPPVATVGDLADRWGLRVNELAWFADRRSLNPGSERDALRHYSYRWVPKRGGSGQRLLKVPKRRLKGVQRRMLDEILASIPVHGSAHGFVLGRSLLGHLSPHGGKHIVITMDLRSWFWHISRARVAGLLRRGGLPTPVCATLASLATAATPQSVLNQRPAGVLNLADRHQERMLLRGPHVPQGAPTSPALANGVSWRMDARLHGLTRKFGGVYTRYADDLAFSGDRGFARSASRFIERVTNIVAEEGFRVHPRKTRTQRRGHAQRICGVVVNDGPRVCRRQRDLLEAMLVNASRNGLGRLRSEGHPRPREWLAGRVAWVAQVHPDHGEKLYRLLSEVPTNPSPPPLDSKREGS